MTLIVVGLVLVWSDHRRLLRARGPRPHNTETLKGRVLQLRDDLQGFLERAGEMPETKREPGMSSAEYGTARIRDAVVWSGKVEHGFALRFADRAIRIYHECGEAGTAHDMFFNPHTTCKDKTRHRRVN